MSGLQAAAAPGASFCENCGTRILPQQPVPVQQPQYAQPAPVQPPAAQSPQKSRAPIVVIIILLLVIVGLVIGIIYLRRTGKGGGEGSSRTEHSSTEPASSASDATTATPVQTADQTESVPPEQFNPDGYPANSTFDRPTIDEMMWVANAREAGVPAGAAYLDFGSACLGGWKCRMFFDESTTMLLNVIIGDGGDTVRVNLDWYLTWFNGEEPINDEDLDDGILDGYEWGAGIYAEGDGKLTIDTFYQIGDYQYAVGSYTSPTGMTATVGMMRP
ncbi:MAG: hypothetical protein IJ060_03840 [Oscillospiraceae bacterium]|nr:hypothetical protein [Oscillospiraceae bacterium]